VVIALVNGDINKVRLHQAQFVWDWETLDGLLYQYISRPLRCTRPGHPAMGTGSGFDHCWRRNGEFGIAMGPFTRNAGILVY